MPLILAIDQGTTSTRAMVFDRSLRPVSSAQQELHQYFPCSGQVEHDPADLWQTVLNTARAAIRQVDERIAAIGITNQRETTLLWDRQTGEPLHRAIVWQDRRTADICAGLRAQGVEPLITGRTGLLLDPYFSATKLKWMLDTLPGARQRALQGKLAFGTVDSWLIWNLTGGQHVTDATNASRTMLYDIGRNEWDAEICEALDIPMSLLPEVRNCAGPFGLTRQELFGYEIPILGCAGDQQAAAMGQACFQPGMLKATYGTGCFALLNTGAERITSQNRLLTTIASRLEGVTSYAIEGSIFIAGAAVQWLKEGLGLIHDAADTQPMAENANGAEQVIMVPAFAGLGAPWWRPDCRGAIYGLTRNTGPNDLARAALESLGFQTRDLLEAMRADWQGDDQSILRVDGGAALNDWSMQFLADIIGAPVDRSEVTETTALGAAWLAGWAAGLAPSPEVFTAQWALERRFVPQMAADERKRRHDSWRRAVTATMGMADP